MCNWLKYFIGDLRSAFIYIIQQNAAAQKDEFPLIPVNSLFPLQRWEADEKSCFHAFSSRLLPTNPVSSVSCTEQHMTQMNSLRTCADLKATNGKIYSLEAKLFLLPIGWRCQRQIITVSGRFWWFGCSCYRKSSHPHPLLGVPPQSLSCLQTSNNLNL